MMKTIKLWWAASAAMVILFGISCLRDWLRPKSAQPYWAFVTVRMIEFLIPAAIFAIIAIILGIRSVKKKEEKK